MKRKKTEKKEEEETKRTKRMVVCASVKYLCFVSYHGSENAEAPSCDCISYLGS